MTDRSRNRTKGFNMGFFSWKTQDTDQSISNSMSCYGTFPVTMRDNKGNLWQEEDYEGYGVFGGKDFYELLAEMNGLPPDRDNGIDLWFSKKKFLSPNLNAWSSTPWKDEAPKKCEYQGYFYPGNEDEDYDEDEQLDESTLRENARTDGVKQTASDLGAKMLATARKKSRLTSAEIDDLFESYLISSATDDESEFIAKHPTEVCDAVEAHNSDRPTKAQKVKTKETVNVRESRETLNDRELLETAQRDLFMITGYFDHAKDTGDDVSGGNPLISLPAEYFEFIMSHSDDDDVMPLEELKAAAKELSIQTGRPADELYSSIRSVCEFFEAKDE